MESIKTISAEELISYIENDAEIPIPIDKFFNEDGSHLTKQQYGKVLLEVLCVELRERFKQSKGTRLSQISN